MLAFLFVKNLIKDYNRYMRINKYLASCELGSRRKVEQFVIDGKVVINGNVITDLSYIVQDFDEVFFDGNRVNVNSNKVYVMLNKPVCYITSMSDEKGRKTVIDLLKKKGFKDYVFPVGRLDYNSEGLLLLTNDGDFDNSIIHPSKHINKTYLVYLKTKPTNSELTKLRNGIDIDGEITLPAEVKFVGNENEYYIIQIKIFEGKNREIRKMFTAINHKVYKLIRIKIGQLGLGDLKSGEYKLLTETDIEKIFE